MRYMPLFSILVLLLTGCTSPPTEEVRSQNTAPIDEVPLDRIERLVQEAMTEIGTLPALGLAIVKDDQVLLTRGFGTRNVEAGLPATAETGFYLASVSKQFGGMTASILAEQGRLDLDAPLARFFPGLEMPEGVNLESITVRSLLTHTSGLGYTNDIFDWSGVPRDEFMRMMESRTRLATRDFRYTNFGHLIVGYVVEDVTGTSWKDAHDEILFSPLGMNSTTGYITDALDREFAFPYAESSVGFVRLDVKTEAMMNPAGGHVSTPVDLARWLQVVLNDGRLSGKQVISREAVRDALVPHASLERTFYKFDRFGYGYGWYHSRYDGDLLLHHFGGFEGVQAHVSFMPKHGIGVAAVGNATDNMAGLIPHMVAAYIYDILLGKAGVEERFREELAEAAERARLQGRMNRLLDVAETHLAEGRKSAAAADVRAALQLGFDAGIHNEQSINRVAYQYLEEGQFEMARAALTLNLELHPGIGQRTRQYGRSFGARG